MCRVVYDQFQHRAKYKSKETIIASYRNAISFFEVRGGGIFSEFYVATDKKKKNLSNNSMGSEYAAHPPLNPGLIRISYYTRMSTTVADPPCCTNNVTNHRGRDCRPQFKGRRFTRYCNYSNK